MPVLLFAASYFMMRQESAQIYTWVEDFSEAVGLRPELREAEALQVPVQGNDSAYQRLRLHL